MGKTGDLLRASGMEFGTTTGRPRRCGWLDIVALKYCCQINGFSSLNLTKLDVLTGLKEIKLGISYYTEDGNAVQSFPADLDLLEQIKVKIEILYPVLLSCVSLVYNFIIYIQNQSSLWHLIWVLFLLTTIPVVYGCVGQI